MAIKVPNLTVIEAPVPPPTEVTIPVETATVDTIATTETSDAVVDDIPEPIYVPPLRQANRPREWYMPCMWNISRDENGVFKAVSNVTQEVFEGDPKEFARMLRNE